MVSMRNGPRKESGRSTNISYRGLLPSLIFSLVLVLLLLFLLVLIKVVEAMLVVAAAAASPAISLSSGCWCVSQPILLQSSIDVVCVDKIPSTS